ncbi:Universal stress protein UspA-like protein (fragment) [Candidatus Desulfosporosinus infrequens]|uniref:Universal stress protein UspA-like protein n=1 Tax=Candidatus Desulfosporosinus infrequens TaxID=2043169 RepID=A0A2U3LV35_9FIRM
MQRIIKEADHETKKQYQEILAKTNQIFSQKDLSVKHEILVANNNYVDIAEALIDYAKKNCIKLIIMGTRGPTDLKGLIFGSFAHSMLSKSPIPVLLIKKLPQSFIESFTSGCNISQ